MVRGKLKDILFKIHLWLGLIAAVPILIICLTGAILSFRPQLEELVNVSERKLEKVGETRDLDLVLESYNSHFDISPGRITIPAEENQAVRVYARDREKDIRIDAYFNPYTGELVADRDQSLYGFFTFVMRLHRGMVAGDFGRDLVLYSTIILFILLVSGLFLWVPSKLKAIPKALKINFKARLKALLYQWHTVIGVFSLLFLLAITFSGIYIADKDIREGINAILFGPPQESISKTDTKSENTEVSYSLNQMLLEVDEVLPGNRMTIISFPREASNPVSIYKYNEGILKYRDIASFGPDGTFLELDKMSDRPLSANFRYINRFLHTGEFLGVTGQFLFMLASLAGCILTVTGTWMWIERKRKKKRKYTSNESNKTHSKAKQIINELQEA